MIITVGGIKGGVGKSLISVNLTCMRSTEQETLLIDGDDQGTSSDWVDHRIALGIHTPWTTVRLRGSAIRHETLKLKSSFRSIIIDCGGRDTDSLRAALTISDILLVPFQPKSFDIWTVTKVASLAKEASYINPSLKTYAFINCGVNRGKDNLEAQEILSKVEGIELIPPIIHSRKAFSNATAEGLTVIEGNDPKAIDEIKSLYNYIFK
jgi:chromosome partitioning protein